jgi:hypothetical protein
MKKIVIYIYRRKQKKTVVLYTEKKRGGENTEEICRKRVSWYITFMVKL